MASGGCLVACSATSALSTHPSTAVEVLQKEALGASSSCGRQSLMMMTPMPTSAAITTTEAAAICASTTANNEPTLLMCSGASMIPHPEKAHRGGEDALFLHDSGMGVADGVGSWALQGIDAGLFARSLMLESKKALDAGILDPGKIMQRAHEATKARGLRGSSTALVLVLVDDMLYSANLGDSSYIVIRGGELYHKEQEQTHGFNTPYQLGHQSAGADRASAAMLHRLVIQPGDVIIAGSDGLFDNLYASRIVQLVTEALPSHVLETATTRSHIASSPGRGEAGSGSSISTTDEENMEGPSVPIEEIGEVIQVLAERIAEEAHIAAASKTKRVPFGDAAEKHGMIWHGGKMDDITVCVSLITGSGAGNSSINPSTSSLQQQSAKL